MKNILLIIPSMRHGGAERVMSILANEWSKNEGIKVNLLLLTKQKIYYKLDSRINLIEPEREYSSSFISKVFYSFWIILFIRNVVKGIKPISTLSFCEIYNNLVLLSLVGLSYPIWVSDRNNPANNLGFLHEYLRKVLYQGANGIIAQTRQGAVILRTKTRNSNIHIVPNPLRDVEIKNEINKENIILNIGRNVEQKNQLELIDIFASLSNAEHWKLQILGMGHLRDDLIRKIKFLGLGNRVELLDFQEDVDSFYQRASIFAFPSLYEGFPNALSEAMAHSLPCISYDCPTGPSELINDSQNGFLINISDKVEFVKKLQLLIDDFDLRTYLGENAKISSQKFSVKEVNRQYLNTILEDEINY